MVLFPEGTLRRKYFEKVDRFLSGLVFGRKETMSTVCGQQLFAGNACVFCKILCWFCSLLEGNHCIRNKDRS